MFEIDPERAICIAIKLLDNIVTCGQTPSGKKLTPDALDLYQRSARCLTTMLEGMQSTVSAELAQWRVQFLIESSDLDLRINTLLAELQAERAARETDDPSLRKP
jgi:hypothetical protein